MLLVVFFLRNHEPTVVGFLVVLVVFFLCYVALGVVLPVAN